MNSKKICRLSILLSCILFISLCPVQAYAEDFVPEESFLENPGVDQSEVLVDYSAAQQVQTLVVNQLVMPAANEEEEEVEVYTLGSQASLENIPFENVVIFQGTFDGDECFLVFPASAAASFFVTDGGILTNVSGSNIIGRLFRSDTFEVTDYNYTIFTLTPILTSSGATSTYRYDYPSYSTYYSAGSTGNNLASTNTYGNFYVTQRIDTDLTSVDQDIYLLVLLLTLIQGSMFIFSWMRVSKN